MANAVMDAGPRRGVHRPRACVRASLPAAVAPCAGCAAGVGGRRAGCGAAETRRDPHGLCRLCVRACASLSWLRPYAALLSCVGLEYLIFLRPNVCVCVPAWAR